MEAEVEPRFGRCAYFLIVDSETMHFEAFSNPATSLGGGAGPRISHNHRLLIHSKHVAKHIRNLLQRGVGADCLQD